MMRGEGGGNELSPGHGKQRVLDGCLLGLLELLVFLRATTAYCFGKDDSRVDEPLALWQ